MAGKKGRSGTNKNQDKPWSDALRRAVKRAVAKGAKTKRLEQLADKCVELALAGDMQAMKEIGDRLDGRAAQAVVGANNGPITLRIERVIIGPGEDPDG